jgi:hypothetical protein
MRAAAAALCALALCSTALGRWADAQESGRRTADRGMLGVVRRDGIVVPFAAFNGDDWKMPWPVTARGQELPLTLDDIPRQWWGGKPPADWQVHLVDGTPRALTMQAPVVYPVYCHLRPGIRSDYRSTEPAPPPPMAPYPKDGLAVTPALDVLPISTVSLAAPVARGLVDLLTPTLNKLEDESIRRANLGVSWKHPFKREDRYARPIKIEAWYSAPTEAPGWSASYVEAVRSYPPGPDDEGCGLETFFRGWVLRDERQPDKPQTEMTAKLTYCDRAGALYMLPFGRIQVASHSYWVFQLSGWDREWYEVVRVSPPKIKAVVEFFGGGRAGCGPDR